MKPITLIYFEGCPNVEKARNALQNIGQPFQELVQDKLSEQDPRRRYSSPTVLLAEKVIYGTETGTNEGGCSVEPFKEEQLKAAISAKMFSTKKGAKGGWIAQVGSVFSAGIVGFCPLCIPAVAAFLAATGLGFLVNQNVLKSLLVFLLLLTLGGLFWSYRKEHRKPYPMILGAIMAISLYLGRYVSLGSMVNTLLLYGGMGGIVSVSIWNLFLRRKRPCPSCVEGQTT